MQINLPSRFPRFAFGATCLAGLCWYLQLCSSAYLASRLAASPGLSSLNRAIKLEPSNAEYHDLLGRTLWLSGEPIEDALSNYRAATRLNPYSARYWLDLAAAYQVQGRSLEQEKSVESAASADPTTPHVAWEAANFFLSEGKTDRAFRHLRVVLANDPASVDAALLLCWRASGEVNRIVDSALPPRADLYLAFLSLLINHRQTDAAEILWNRLIGLRQPVPIASTLPYFRFLIGERQVAAAQAGWLQLAGLDPSLAPYLPGRENLVVNGGFEKSLLNGGFDWMYVQTLHVSLAIDSSEFYRGARSLAAAFDGQSSVEEAGISQYIAVRPDTDYQFTFAYKTEDLETASGPRLAIVDAYTNQACFLGPDAMGTHGWDTQRAEFRTGPNTSLVLLKIVRQPAAPLIRGRFWLDDVRLTEK